MEATPSGGGGGPNVALRIGLAVYATIALALGGVILSGCGAATDVAADTTIPEPVESGDDAPPADSLDPTPADIAGITIPGLVAVRDEDAVPLGDVDPMPDDAVATTFPGPVESSDDDDDPLPVYGLDPMPEAFSWGGDPRVIGYEPAWDLHASADPTTQGFHNSYGTATDPVDRDAMADVWYTDANRDDDWIEGRRCNGGSGADEHSEIVVDGGITAQVCSTSGTTRIEWLLTGPAVPPGMSAGAVVRVRGGDATDRARVIELAQSLRSQLVDVPPTTDQAATVEAGDATRLVLVADPLPASWVPLRTGHPFLTQNVTAFTWVGTTGSDGAHIVYEFWVTTYVGVDDADEIIAVLTAEGDYARRTARGREALIQEAGHDGRANMHVVWAEDAGTVVSVTSLLAGPRGRVLQWIERLEPVTYPTSNSS